MAKKNTREKNESFNRNPEGKGGFGDHPELINRDGAPRKGESLAEVIRAFMDGDEDVEIKSASGETIATETVHRKLMYVKKLFRESVIEGRPYAFRILANYHDGMPPQSVNLTGALFTGGITDLPPDAEERVMRELDGMFGIPSDFDGGEPETLADVDDS